MRGWEDQEEASDGCARPPGELANGRTVVPGGPLTLLDRLQLCRAAWAPGGPWDRDGAFTALWGRPPGSFLVLSDSASRPQLLCLSVGGNVQAVRDFPIRCTGEVFHLPESHLGFSDLVQLVAFYSLCRDVLPLCLFLPPCLYGITEEPGQNLSHLGPKFWLCPSPGQKLDDVSMRSTGITMCSIQVTSANGALCVVNPLYLHEHGDAWLRPTPSPQSGKTANHKRPQSGQTANQKRERRLSTTRPWGGAGLRNMRGPSLDHEPPDMRTDVSSKTAPSESPTVPPPASPSVPDRVVLRRASQPTGCESFRRQSQGAPAGEARRFSDGLGPQSPHRVSWIEEGVWLSPPPSVTHPPSLELDSLSVSSLEEEPEGGGSPAHQHHAHHRLTLVLADKMKNRLSAVGQAFGGLLSPQKRLQKRVQELSERRSGAFPEALRGFLELTQRGHARAHPTAADMLQEVRNALTGLREALFDCPEIQVLVDGMGDVSDWELDAMVEESLHKVALKPVSSHLYACLREFRSSDGTLQQLQENQKALETQDPKGLGGTAGAGVPDALTLEKIQQRWASMHQAYSPSKKVETLLKVCKIIYHSMSANASSGAVFGADDFLPCLTWVLLRCDVTTLQLDTDYMMELLDPTQLQGEGGYYLTSLYASLFYISSFQPRLATRQLSVEAQQSLSKWHRRRTLHCNQGRQSQNRRTIRRHAPGEGAGPQREAGPADGDVSQRGGAGTEPAREELAVLGEEEGCPEPPRTGSSAEAEEPGVCPPEGGQEGRGEQGSAREGRGLPETAGKHETERSEKEEERFQERGFADCSWDRGTGSQGQAEVAQIPLDSSGECAR